MKLLKSICIALICLVSNVYAQNNVLSIEDALKITKMKNMQEASDFLIKYGYTESREKEPFYYREVATFWVKGCKVEHGIDCITTVEVNDKCASSISLLATSDYGRLTIQVHNNKTKDDLLNQMKALGFKRVAKTEYGDIIYTHKSDTIEVSQEELLKIYTIDSLGEIVPIFYTTNYSSGEKEPEWMMFKDDFEKDIKSWHKKRIQTHSEKQKK